MTAQEALNSLISKTDIMNNTCAYLGKCVKRGKCEFREYDCNECEDYKTAMMLQKLVDCSTPIKPIKHSYEEVGELPYSKFNCPKCEQYIHKNYGNYCIRCGQALDWSEEDENTQ